MLQEHLYRIFLLSSSRQRGEADVSTGHEEIESRRKRLASKRDSVPTVTLSFSSSDMSTALTKLTIYLLQENYAFLQIFHHNTHTDFDIFHPRHQPAVRLTLRVIESGTTAAVAPAPAFDHLDRPDTASLIQRLLEVCTPASGNLP